jgi:methionyl-tRNA synthetase
MICDKCRKIFPPGFVESSDPYTGEQFKGNFCIFCARDKDVLEVKGRKITKNEILK